MMLVPFFFFPSLTQGAVVIDANVSRDQGAGISSIATPAFSTTSTNELLLALIASDGPSGSAMTVNSVGGAGLTWTLVVRTNTQLGTAEIWRAFAATTLSNAVVTASLAGAYSASLTVLSFSGVDISGTNGSGAIGAVGRGNGASGAPTASLATTRNGSWVFGVGNDWDRATARTVGAGQTLVHQYLASVGDTYWVQMQNSATLLSGTTVTINDTAPTTDEFNLSICEVLPATVAGPTWKISGSITNGGGATVVLGGAAGGSVTADAQGNYNIPSLANGTYTVTPSLSGYSISPVSQTVTINGSDVQVPAFIATAIPVTYSISGTITNGAGAAVALSGAASATVTANSSESYTFAGLQNGSYTVAPTLAGYTISPSSQTVTVNGSNVAVPAFTATVISTLTYSLSGTISSGSGATVTLTGAASRTTTANNRGNYSFTGLPNGIYTLTPVKSSYAISPTSRTVTINGANVTAVNFTATRLYTIAGTIASGAGATVNLTGASTAATTANGTGAFSFSVPNGTYIVTPSLSQYVFSPVNRSVTVNGANVSSVNFSASFTGPTYTISGTIIPASLSSGTAVNLTGAATRSTTADINGNFSFTGLVNGSYTATPVKSGVKFTPTSQTATVNGANVVLANFTAAVTATPNLTVNLGTLRQTIDGMGSNVNVNGWSGGQLMPALDYLVDVAGESQFRVIRDPMTWVSSESLIPALHNLDPVTLGQVYETPAMQDIWNTIGYLNQKGIVGNHIQLNFMGGTPVWMGGGGSYNVASYITSGKEQAFATMVASLVYYGRVVRNLSFNYLSPMNEEDWNCLEGPCLSASQYGKVMDLLNTELNAMGVTDVRFVAPETVLSQDPYLNAMGTAAFARTDHITWHNYGGFVTNGTSYAGKNYWVTETAASCGNCDTGGTPSQGEWTFASDTNDNIILDLLNGLSLVLVYDAFDSYYYHHGSMGYWGLLALNQTNGTFTPRKRFYVNAQLTRFLRPGMKVTSITDSISALSTVISGYDPATEKFSIVGHNSGSSAITINGNILNIPSSITSLKYYQTNASVNLQQGADVAVSGGTFSISVPANTFFSLSNY